MKQKLVEYINNHPGTSVWNKNATRYLYKREPELWKWILASTCFLPDNAKPKQRCWHILNDNFTRPVCPVTGEFTKWNENRYLEYISLSAKAKSSKVTAKRMKTYADKTGHSAWNSKSNEAGYEKFKDTNFEKYGTWATGSEELKKQILDTKIKNGVCRTEEEKSALEIYMLQVENFTKDSWYYSYSRINPDGLERGKEYHLDHIYSRKEGFDNNVPPEIIGHWTNLQLMPAKENNGKHSKCGKTIEKLYEDYRTNIRT
jgi:hypothetical protein